MKPLLPALLLAWLFATPVRAQIIYFSDVLSNVYTFNVQTCATTILPVGPAINDMAVGPGNVVYGLFGNFIINTSTGTAIANIPGIVTGLEYGPNGLIYALGTNLWSFNPATNTLLDLGALPNNWFCTGDIVYLNGIYYATVYDITNGGNHQLISVNMTNPALSTIITTPPTTNLVAGASVDNATCPKLYWFDSPPGSPSILYEYDVNTQAWTTLCPNFTFLVGGADTPNGYTFQVSCACGSVAGNIPSPDLDLCVNEPLTFPATTGQVLDNNDLLQYIIFDDPVDILGSILATSFTPSFSYNPALYTPGTMYYIAAIVGSNLNGQVDLLDPCLDISNAVGLVWRTLPTVSLQAPTQPLCAGACVDIPLNLSGAAPFSLTYTTPFGGTQTQTFPAGGSQILTLCIPENQSTGSIQVQPLSIQDAFCICP